MRPCFAFSAKTANTPAVLAIDDDIGFWGVQARDFRNALDGVEGDTLEVQINSLGGDVMAGLGMYNMLRNWAGAGKQITTRVTGVAASIASIVMLAGDKREMPSNAFAMVHSVKSGAWGTAEEIRDQADVVDKVQTSLRNIYVARMGIDEDRATEIMAKDTWLDAAECLEMGFVTAVVDPVQATAKFSLDRAALPENVAKVFAAKASDESGEPPTEPVAPGIPDGDVLPDTPLAEAIAEHAKSLGLEAHAKVFALACATMEDAQTRMTQAREILALCAVVGAPTLAAKHIRDGTPLTAVRASLAETLAKDDVAIDNAPRNSATGQTNGESAKPTVVTPTSLWASHNSQSTKGR